jgi:DNA-binding transcriptional MerR regulator
MADDLSVGEVAVATGLGVGEVAVASGLGIGEVAAATGLSVDTIRFYDRAGFVQPGRDAAGRRRYTHPDVEALAILRQFRRIGLSLAQIRTLFDVKQRGGPTPVRLAAIDVSLREIRASIESRRRDLDEAADTVDAWLAEVDVARRG